jgi:hypothetical protein
MQENVIKMKTKEIITTSLVRYFFLTESLQDGREKHFANHNIQWSPYKKWGISIYAHKNQHKKLVHLFQNLLLQGPRYFSTS